jgi:NAD(P)-dependent dehydrogenase (short-subunit alcohol dehydrogenase family)
MAVAVDVRDRASIKRMVDGALDKFGKIGILVNNAGGSAREKNAFFHESPDEVLEWVLGVNLLGPLFCIKAVIGHMIERRRGKIANIASIVGIQGKQKLADYSAAKGGLIAFTKSLAMEVGAYNINVNCVSPGLVPRSPAENEIAARRSYLGRPCKPENIADLVAFLCSEEASYITGQNYVIDGGRSLGLKGD